MIANLARLIEDRLFVSIRAIRGFLYAIRIDEWTRVLMGTNDIGWNPTSA
jgi:hypothetical protein